MAVRVENRSVYPAQFLEDLFELATYISIHVVGKFKSGKNSIEGKNLEQAALNAYKYATIANNIYAVDTFAISDFETRRHYFQRAYSEVDTVQSFARIFLNKMMHQYSISDKGTDKEKKHPVLTEEKCFKHLDKISTFVGKIKASIRKIITSDNNRFKKYQNKTYKQLDDKINLLGEKINAINMSLYRNDFSFYPQYGAPYQLPQMEGYTIVTDQYGIREYHRNDLTEMYQQNKVISPFSFMPQEYMNYIEVNNIGDYGYKQNTINFMNACAVANLHLSKRALF